MITWIINASLICNIPPANIEAIIRVESSYCLQTVSKKSSARGCMQLLSINRNVFDTLDHERSIYAGTRYLCKLKSRFPRSYMLRYYIGPSGDITVPEVKEYKRRLNLPNKYFKGVI